MRMIPRDLSRTPTLDAFLERYAVASATVPYVLKPGGILAVLMGDYHDREAGLRPAHLPHQAACLRVRPQAALDRHHPLQPRRQQRQEGLPLILHPRPARRVHAVPETLVTQETYETFDI